MPINDIYNDVSATSTHDLWVEARKFELQLARSSPSTLTITIRRPALYQLIDGAVLLLSEKPIGPNDFPQDGVQYTESSTIWGNLAAKKIGEAQVIEFWSNILQLPFPSGLNTAGDVFTGNKLQYTIEVTGVDPSKVYYASIHASSSVLQYYPLGIQSYPLEASSSEKDSRNYAASIPSLPSAPLAPTPGMVYYDQQLNSVQYWDNSRSVWIPTRTDQIKSGEYNPAIPGQAYLIGGSIKVFDGKKWSIAQGANLQLRTSSSTWIPLNSVKNVIAPPETNTPGDMIYDFTARRITYWDGLDWIVPDSTNTLFSVNGNLFPAFTTPFRVEPVDLLTPYPGLLFYNTVQRQLNVWNGNAWELANTDQAGTPTSDKTGIGNDGSYDQRIRLVNIMKNQLGWPALCVELAEEQFNIAIDNALDTYRQLCISATEQRYILFTLIPDQQLYFLNSPVDQTDRVVTVHKIHRATMPYGYTGAGPEDTWAHAWTQHMSDFSHGGDLLSMTLLAQWGEDFKRTFAGDLPFNWYEARRELHIHRAIRTPMKVVLEVEMERTEQELMLDRYCKQFIQGWAVAEAKYMLGMIRSKYSSGTPGPSGTITLNGDTLLAEARQDFAELKEGLLNYEYQNAEHGNVSLLFG